MRVMRKHDLTNKKTITKTKTMTMTKTMTKTFRECPQRAILETYDLWDIRSEKWGDMTWLTKRQWQRQIQWKRQRQWQLQKHPQRTISETCDLWDTGYISDNWEQQSEHSQWTLNKEWQGQHSQFLRCLKHYFKIRFGGIWLQWNIGYKIKYWNVGIKMWRWQ